MNKVKRYPPFLTLPLITTFSFAMAMSSCNFNKQKIDTDNGVVAPITAADLTYANLNAKVFDPYCTSCHSVAGGNSDDVNLESYANVINNLAMIRATAIETRSMPKGGVLSASDYALLKAWTDAGAPEGN